MKRIRAFSILLSSALLLFTPARVDAAQEYVPEDDYGFLEVDYTTEYIPEDYHGYLEIDYTPERIYTDIELEKLGMDLGIPSKYDSREYGYVSGIRNQNPYGTCWSFSVMAALEGSVLRQGLASDIDLSEYHLLNYSYQYVVDPLGGTEGDDIIFHGTMSDFLNHGGNVLIAYHALTNWLGATADTGYVTDSSYVMPKTVESAYLNDIIHLEEVGIMNKNDTVAVKQAIMDYGVITCSYYHHDGYMNYSTGAYYMNDTTNSNHAVAIIGWDDNYSKYNFLDTPSADGAWLVKNSWGTGFGNDGYFWISYEDTSLQESMCYLVAAPADKYDHNYQYDGSYFLGGYGAYNLIKGANVFRVPATAKAEVLEAISFEPLYGNVDYEVQVYLNPTSEADPSSGEALLSIPVTGSLQFAGFYTVEMPEAIVLNPGDTFSVVVTLKSQTGGAAYMSVEADMLWGDVEFVADAKPGQSFLGLANGDWSDIGEGAGESVRIKAFTCDADKAEREAKVRAFVERMYTIVLGRAAEEQGLSDWTARLMAKKIDGATLVDMFVNSDEFVNRNTSDEEYIKILYRAVLGREADADGLQTWKAMLADDWTRDYVLEGLVLSTEFKNICDSYGIIAAFEPTAESQVRSFVKRMYTVVLNRRADAVGLEDWTKQLMNGTVNGAKVADGFINSQEFANRNLSNEKYVKVLYRAFFNREPDEGGFNVWMNELAKGTSRRDVMKGFVHSVEFSDLCAQYGIIRGEIQ